ncbi:MAG: glycosyltransferase family 4 protein [Brevundimonas sp.]
MQTADHPRILCVHPSAELYGSDRAFLESVEAIRARWPGASIEVELPINGPLVPELERVSIVRIKPRRTIARSRFVSTAARFLLGYPAAAAYALNRMRRFDAVYINTVVPLDFISAGIFIRRRVCVHVHEIPGRTMSRVLGWLFSISAGLVIFNSAGTQGAYDIGRTPHVIIHNGFEMPPLPEREADDGRFKIVMIGRISRLKGQRLLVSALKLLPPDVRAGLDVRIVGGSIPGREDEVTELEEHIRTEGLGAIVGLHPFSQDPSPHFSWTDVVVVPSIEPESFGRVAAEGGAHGRAVIAAAHGGLPEIVNDQDTGWLFRPGDAADLARVLTEAKTDPERLRAFGLAGRAQVEAMFSRAIVDAKLTSTLETFIAGSGRQGHGR